METLFDEFEKRNGCIQKITRKEKEQRHMEGINHLIGEGRYQRKIIMPHHHQQDADTARNVDVFNSFGWSDWR